MEYFSDQERGKTEASSEDISKQMSKGILAHINSLIIDGSFGKDFPKTCEEFPEAIIGTDESLFMAVCGAEIPKISDLPGHLSGYNTKNIETLDILDLIQFCYNHVYTSSQLKHHEYYRHDHLTFDRDNGRKEFLDKINKIFERNGIVFRLQHGGSIVRVLPSEFCQLLDAAKSGHEAGFDDLLADAKTKIHSPDPRARKEGLERLWDAWERLKTLGEGKDKKAQAANLLDKAASSTEFRNLLEEEANKLRSIGNNFTIRHHEQGKVEINNPIEIDYLFFRMLSMIVLLLKARRGTL